MNQKLLSWLSLAILAVLLSLTPTLTAIADTPKHYTELEFDPVPEIQLPEYERHELDNGMVVYLLEDRDLPLVSGNALIRTGSRFEPANKVGLAQLTGTLMRSGGTINYPSAELNAILEQNAASVETSIGNTSGSVSFNTLREDLDTVFPLFTEVLRQPAFAPDKLAIAITQQQGSIARRNDDPGDIASREFDKVIYGAASPYARTVEYETLANISRQDIVNFYQTYVRPESIILGVVGDFDSEEMLQRIKTAFADWQVETALPALDPPSASQKHTQGLYVVDRPQLTQSNILLGHLGGQFNSPDYPSLSVLNEIINGFGGRLFNQIRSRQGLAYSVYGAWSPGYDYDGLFIAGGQTQTRNTVPFVRSVISELTKLRQELVSEPELEDAKESILNSFVFNFQSPSQTLSRLMRYEYYDYPPDFIFDYQKQVQQTSPEDIFAVAQEYIQPDKIVTLVVGNQQAMNPPLSSLTTEINLVDVSISAPGQG